MSNTVPLGSSPERQGSDICGLEYFALVIGPIEPFRWISKESSIQQSHRACSGNRWNHYAQPMWKTEKVRQNIIQGRQGCCAWAKAERVKQVGEDGVGWAVVPEPPLLSRPSSSFSSSFFFGNSRTNFFFPSFSWAMGWKVGMPQAVVPGGRCVLQGHKWGRRLWMSHSVRCWW